MARFRFKLRSRSLLAVLATGLGLAVFAPPATAAAPYGPWGCPLLLTKEKELAYWEAKTPAARRQARQEFFAWIQELRAHHELVEGGRNLSPAWWNAAFSRKHAPVPMPGQMDMDELATLLRSKDGALYLEALRSAYKISEFRLATSLAFQRLGDTLAKGFRRAGNWTARNALDPLSRSLVGRAGRGASRAGTAVWDALADTGDWVVDQTYGRLPRKLRAKAEYLFEKLRAPKPDPGLKPPPFWSEGFQVAPSVSNAERARTITLYAALKLRSALVAGVDFVLPLHLRTFLPEKWIERTLPIFTKLERNSRYVPTADELATLRKYGAVEAFEKRRAYLQHHPYWSKGLRYTDTAYRWAVAGFVATAVAVAVMQSSWGGDAPMTLEEYLAQPLLPNQIQLINETAPFPHLAVRVGNVVYSYGYTNMTATPVSEYLRSHQPAGPGSGGFAERNRSVQIVTLNLAPAEAAKMQSYFRLQDGQTYDFAAIEAAMHPDYRNFRRHLSLQENKRYRNVTFVNDCATMLVRALKQHTSIEIPDEIDPSPSSIVMYLAAGKLSGTNPKVESVRLVLGNPDQNPTLLLLRNAYINAREARLFYHPLAFAVTRTQRKVFDATHSPKDREYFEKAFLERETARRDEVAAAVAKDRDLEHYLKFRAEIATAGSAKRASAKQYFDEVYEEQLAYLESNYTDLANLLGALYKLELYADYEQKLLGTRSFTLSKALDDSEFRAEIQDLLETLSETPPSPK